MVVFFSRIWLYHLVFAEIVFVVVFGGMEVRGVVVMVIVTEFTIGLASF